MRKEKMPYKKSILILLTSLVTTYGNQCKTLKNMECVFPFQYRNLTYAGCTDHLDPDEKLWCSTKVTSEGEHVKGEWGHCTGDCPTAEERRNPVCEVLEVEDEDEGISSGTYSVDKENDHQGRSVYVNTEKNLHIFWLSKIAGWGLGNESGLQSGKVLYSSGPEVHSEPWQGVWQKSKVKVVCAEDTIFTRSGLSLSQNDKTCAEHESCYTRENCPALEELYQKVEDKTDPGRKQAITQLRSMICNQAERGFCCPVSLCEAGTSCKTADQCSEVKEKLRLVRYGNLPYRDSIEIYRDLESRICDTDKERFCCEESDLVATAPPAPTPVSDGTFLPDASQRSCGLESQETSHFIINGNNTKPGEFPFMALLGVKVRKKVPRKGVTEIVTQWVCGGSLINHWYVLTAAHCQAKKNPLAYVRLGDWDVSTKDCVGDVCLPEPQDFDITRENFIGHEEYSRTTRNVYNDIALIRLPRPAQLNNGVKFACLPLSLAERSLGAANERGEVIGWGHTNAVDSILQIGGDLDTDNIAKATQQSAHLPIVSREVCNTIWSLTGGLQPGQICVGGGDSDSCTGDSGGPLVMKVDHTGTSALVTPWVVTGVVSFGSKFCASGMPGVYSRVAHYLDWIQAQLRQ